MQLCVGYFFIGNKRIFDDFNITFCYNENRGRYEK